MKKINTIYNFDFNIFLDNLKNIFKLDAIRIQKILEILQFTIIYAIITLYIGAYIDHYLFPDYKKNTDINTLIKEVILQSIVIAICHYYIKKLGLLFPFLFKFTKDYEPGLKNEYELGFSIGLSIIFFNTQIDFSKKIIDIVNYFY